MRLTLNQFMLGTTAVAALIAAAPATAQTQPAPADTTADATTGEDIIVVGTAGAIHDDVEATVHEVTAAIQHDVTDLDNVVGQHVSLPAMLSFGGTGHTIATGDHFVDDADAAAGIRDLGATLVDMEVYAYVWVAQQYDVPIRVLKAVSDRAQDGARWDWGEATDACSVLLLERMRRDYDL